MIAAALLLLFGTLFLIPGVAGWFLVAANNPHPDDLATPRAWAAIGRILTGIGIVVLIVVLITGHTGLGGAALGAVVLAAILATASLITLSPLAARTAGATS